MNTNIRWLAAYTADIFDDYLAEIKDGLWRCHSWVVQPRSRTMRVWETTVKRVAYFGFVMNDTECQEFLDNNT